MSVLSSVGIEIGSIVNTFVKKLLLTKQIDEVVGEDWINL